MCYGIGNKSTLINGMRVIWVMLTLYSHILQSLALSTSYDDININKIKCQRTYKDYISTFEIWPSSNRRANMALLVMRNIWKSLAAKVALGDPCFREERNSSPDKNSND